MELKVQETHDDSQKRSEKQTLAGGLERIRAHYAFEEGEARLVKLLTRSFNWALKWSVLAAGAFLIDATLLTALFATTDDWKIIVNALHNVSAETANNWFHHELLPQAFFTFAEFWAVRVFVDIFLVGFAPNDFPNGAFEPRMPRGPKKPA
jgi:hypothetical protein